MKKVISIVLTLVLLLPLIVFADGGSPTFAPYDAYVSNKDGASLYDYDYDDESYIKTSHFLEYNHQIRIEDEEEVADGVVYGRVEFENADEIEVYYINMKNVKPLKDEYTYEDLKKEFLGEDSDYAEDDVFYNDTIILAEDSVIYKGPSKKYDKTDKIIKKEVPITKKAQVGDWVYVDDGSISGWIIDNPSVVMDKGESSLWTIIETPAFTNPKNLTGKPDIVIPKDTKFDNVYEYYYRIGNSEDEDDWDWYGAYRVEYEGNIYYINDDELIALSRNSNERRFTFDETDCYDEINGTIIATIPENTEVIQKYYADNDNKNSYHDGMKDGDEWIYVEYKGKGYWVIEEGRSINFFSLATYSDSKIMLVSDFDASLTFDHNNEHPNTTIPANTQIEGYYYMDDNAYYVEYKGKKYWINEYERDICDYIDDDWSEYEVENDIHLYDKVNGEKNDVIIPAGTTIDIRYEYYDEDEENRDNSTYWYYVDTKKYKGWINENENTMTEFKEELAKSQVNETIEDKRKQYVKPQKVTNEPDVVKSDNKLSKKELIIICSLSAVIVALLIVVIILLVNKKKREKQNVVEEPTPVAVAPVEASTEPVETPTEVVETPTEVVEEKVEETTIVVETNKEENKDA